MLKQKVPYPLFYSGKCLRKKLLCVGVQNCDNNTMTLYCLECWSSLEIGIKTILDFYVTLHIEYDI